MLEYEQAAKRTGLYVQLSWYFSFVSLVRISIQWTLSMYYSLYLKKTPVSANCVSYSWFLWDLPGEDYSLYIFCIEGLQRPDWRAGYGFILQILNTYSF